MGAPALNLNRDLPQSYKARFTPDDFRFFRMVVHPTARVESKEVTRRLLAYLAEQDIVTNTQLQQALGLSEAPVLKRLKVFREFKLIKRERNKYYRVGPRLQELVRLFMDKL